MKTFEDLLDFLTEQIKYYEKVIKSTKEKIDALNASLEFIAEDEDRLEDLNAQYWFASGFLESLHSMIDSIKDGLG